VVLSRPDTSIAMLVPIAVTAILLRVAPPGLSHIALHTPDAVLDVCQMPFASPVTNKWSVPEESIARVGAVAVAPPIENQLDQEPLVKL
jgi:hypothetical protein